MSRRFLSSNRDQLNARDTRKDRSSEIFPGF